jgi:hypothetical protein
MSKQTWHPYTLEGVKVNPENIPYAAKVNAAAWLIRKARKIARRLTDATPEQQQAIENEIAEIGMRLYSETCEQPQSEATHDPGEDHELEAYVTAVRELVPDAERWFVRNDHCHGFTVEASARRWREYGDYLKGRT